MDHWILHIRNLKPSDFTVYTLMDYSGTFSAIYITISVFYNNKIAMTHIIMFSYLVLIEYIGIHHYIGEQDYRRCGNYRHMF